MGNSILKIKGQGMEFTNNSYQARLVNELWGLLGKCNRQVAENISTRSSLPLKWIDKIPSSNGEKGTEKLAAERGVLLLRNRTSPFIEQFNHPIGRCARFYKLTAYNNCNFWCEYCYLYLTFRTNPISTHFVNYEKMLKEIIAFDKTDMPESLRVLNLGELCDPLAVEDITGFAEMLIPFVAENTKKTKLLFLTKSDNIESLLRLRHDEKSIMSFSINTDNIYRRLEHRTASPKKRLVAAKKLQDAGYEVRLRIDPVIIYKGWQEDYIELVDTIFAYVKPSRITIGEYRPSRGLAKHIESRFPESILLRINDRLVNDGVKFRYPETERIAAFKAIIDRVRQHKTEVRVSLCKENLDIWNKLGMEINGLYCNCLG